jgi:hypothetical protein
LLRPALRILDFNGGNGFGGGIYIAAGAMVNITGSKITANLADGGAAGSGGNPGSRLQPRRHAAGAGIG